MNIPIITYTNSRCSDALVIYLDLLRKYYGIPSHTILTDRIIYDNKSEPLPNIKYITYNDKDPFYDIWIRCLSNFQSKYFLYMQEDFFLYKPVNADLLNYYLQVMEENDHISCIRLLKSGINSNIPAEGISSLFYVDYNTDYPFSMQPTIWRTKDFLKIQETKIQVIPWDEWKINGDVLLKLDLTSLYHYNNESKRGMSHYGSDVFPYIATALVKGKWNTKEYPELKVILKEYNVDISKRGEYE